MLRIGRTEPVGFASDLHLSEDDPATAQRLLNALDTHAASFAHLFLLGDLFELWVGDDRPDPLADALGERIAGLARAGTRVWAMHGNRDFLLDVPVPGREGPGWARSHGATLLADPCPIVLHDEAALLSHGDALCIDDLEYQAWRRTCRDPQWQHAFLARPLAQRLAMGRSLRKESDAGKRDKPEALTDVNPDEVDRVMAANGVTLLVHGHTHRPGEHRWSAGPQRRRRVVLTDWNAAAGRGALLLWEDGRPRTLD